MILLDANYLIAGTHAGSVEATHLLNWLGRDESLATTAVAWMEFITGPVSAEAIDTMRFTLNDRIVAFGSDEAEIAAQLFNAGGRRRNQRYDSMIAAAAISLGARLATRNLSDFQAFVPHGLKLAN